MHIQVPHNMSQTAAVARIKQGLVEAGPHMQGQIVIDKEEWDGNVLNFAFTAQGKQITGTLDVTDTDFVVDAKLPLLWRMFEGKIEKMIMNQAHGMLK